MRRYHADPVVRKRRAEYQTAYRAANRELLNTKRRSRHATEVEWFNATFKSRPCERCDVAYPPHVLDFHHRDPATKKFALSTKCLSRSRASIRAEVAKCDLLCANCHRIVEYGEQPCPGTLPTI